MKNLGSITQLYIKCILPVIISCTSLLGCKKWAEVDTPPTSTSTQNVYKDASTANSAFIGLYVRLSSSFSNGLIGTSIFIDLAADNIKMYDVNGNREFARFYQNNLDAQYTDINKEAFWKYGYNFLYTVNDAITKLTDNIYLPEKLSTRLLGEAHFLRAFTYFYLTNLYGDVPLVLNTDPEVNSKIPRSAVADVYIQINNDLAKAEGLLTQDYVVGNTANTSTTERLRPNLSTVHAMQARVFLYQKSYSAAEQAATKVITQSAYSLTTPATTFLKNSSETIWALQSTNIGQNTNAGRFFILPTTGPNGVDFNLLASPSLIDSFEAGDLRRSEWIGTVDKDGVSYHFPYKYKVPNIPGSISLQEYDIVLRLAEQYLIRAEARNEQGNTAGAVADLNVLRARRRATPSIEVSNPLPDFASTLTQAQLQPLIVKERRAELFTEWGHRWFDLKRLGLIDAVMNKVAPLKGGTWSNHKALLPIPTSDILLNSALSQNPGYIN